MLIQGRSFENSSTCRGVSYSVPNAQLDLAQIEITGRYPESGWARNQECDEMVRVLRGAGSVVMRNLESIAIESGDVVHIPAGEWFAWDGNMTILMACSPMFDPDKYDIEEGNNEV